MINKSHKIINHNITTIFTIFWWLKISNKLRKIINIGEIKIDHNIFKDFFIKFILISKIRRANFLNLRYKKVEFIFKKKNSKINDNIII